MDLSTATWADLTERQPEETMTPVERADEAHLNDAQKAFRRDGVVVFGGLIPDAVLDAYSRVRAQLPRDRSLKDNYWAGWHHPTPYMTCPEMRAVATAPNLAMAVNGLIGDVMGLHLCLTGWVSTERDFHQDSYLNPDSLWSFYIAAWIALEDIDPDSGPFEFVRGSHKWETLRRREIFRHLNPEQIRSPDWPTFTQKDVARVCEEEMSRRGAKTEYFIAKKGDVLLWHSNLIHRGTKPNNPDLERHALICHYSSLQRRTDMNAMKRDLVTGTIYFDIPR